LILEKQIFYKKIIGNHRQFGGLSVEIEKLEIIESNEFQSLFNKSKKLIDSARSNMGQMANAITVLTSFFAGKIYCRAGTTGSRKS
jgi:hypothetical protein